MIDQNKLPATVYTGSTGKQFGHASVGGHLFMASLLSGGQLESALLDEGFIRDGSIDCVEGVKYDFRMSPIVLKAKFGTPINIDKLPESERAQVTVEPGEVVFVRTVEQLALPNDVMAVLSPKRKLSHQGIIVLGGLSVDPRYAGPLFVGLYNFSSTPFPLQPGKKLIAALFYQLSGTELMDFAVPEATGDGDFPEELVTLIRNYKPVELSAITSATEDLKKRLDALVSEFRDDRTWKHDFQEGLDRQTKQIDKLLEGLKEEKDARKDEDTALRSRLDSMTDLFSVFKIGWVIAALLVAAALGYWVPKAFE